MFERDSDNVDRSYVNGVSFSHGYGDRTPSLFEALDGYDFSRTPGYAIIPDIHAGRVIQIVINNFDDGEHPMHFHGHNFAVMGTGPGVFDEAKNDLADPALAVIRDVVTIDSLSWMVIRFIADNPGLWVLHCHIDWHMSAGLSQVFVELPDQLQQLRLPHFFRSQCAGGSHGHH